jgi:type IV pilus assembly protein PilV
MFHSSKYPLPKARAAGHAGHQNGASLIEVLVAMLLVAMGILAMAAMQVNSTRIAKTSEFRAMGALLAADLADRMRTNRDGVFFKATPATAVSNQYRFDTPYPNSVSSTLPEAPAPCAEGPDGCSASEMAAQDLQAWRRAVAASLPGGWVRVSNVDVADNGVDLWLMWVDVQGTPAAGDAAACPPNVAAAPVTGGQAVAPNCMYFRINL